MQSFDITSGCDLQEVDNGVNQALKEIHQRYDFKGLKVAIEFNRGENKILLRGPPAAPRSSAGARVRAQPATPLPYAVGPWQLSSWRKRVRSPRFAPHKRANCCDSCRSAAPRRSPAA